MRSGASAEESGVRKKGTGTEEGVPKNKKKRKERKEEKKFEKKG